MQLPSFLKNYKLVGILVVLLVAAFLLRSKIIGLVKPEPQYETAKAKKRDLAEIVSASGKVKGDQEATLKFQTSGYLAWVGAKKGDKVKKGQAIASLDKEELQKKLEQELIDYMNERWDFEKDRHDYNITTDKLTDYSFLEYDIYNLLEKAQFDLDRVVLDVEIKNLAIKYATLWTPIDGIVTEIDAPHAGVNITPATAEFVISNPDNIVFNANVDEVDIGQVRQGQKATILLDAYSQQPIESEVSQVSFTSITTSSGGTAYEVKFLLPENTEEKFKVGMNGDVDIIISQRSDVLAVPFEAVREKNDKNYLWIVEAGKPVKKEVKVGFSTDDYSQIVEGVSEGQTVITSGFTTLERNAKK